MNSELVKTVKQELKNVERKRKQLAKVLETLGGRVVRRRSRNKAKLGRPYGSRKALKRTKQAKLAPKPKKTHVETQNGEKQEKAVA